MKNLTSIAEHSDYIETFCNIPEHKWKLHRKRVEFGKQKLEIWQFVPSKLVDGVWVVFEEPKNMVDSILDGDNGREWAEKRIQYQQAKERCLFEGFIYYHNKRYVLFSDNATILFGKSSENGIWHLHKYLEIIEDIVKYKPLLTATAQKQIGF